MNRRAFLALGAAAASGCGRPAGKPFYGFAFVATQGSPSLAVVDLAAFQLAKSIPLSSPPAAVLSHQARGAAYVLTPGSDAIHEVDAIKLQIRRTARLGPDLCAMRFSRDNPDLPPDTLWALSKTGKTLYRIPLASFEPEKFATLSDEPVDFDLATWVKTAAVSYGSKGAVGFFDTAQRSAERKVSLGAEIGAVRFQSNGRQLLVGNVADRSLAILRTSDGAMVTQLPLAVKPENFCTKEDGGEVYISGQGADAVVVVQPYQAQIAATLLAGDSPAAMGVAGYLLLVTNPLSGDLSVIDIETRRLAAIARVGRDPRSVAVTPDGQFALVLNRQSGDMAVIQVPSLRANKFKRASLFTMIPVGDTPVGAAIVRV